MGLVGLVVRLLLVATFAVAGIAKLANIGKARKAVRDFGVPRRLADPLGTLLPFAELGVAGLLIPVRTLFWGGAGAIVLLVAFIVAISINLALGRKPDCNCFGQVASKPIGWSTLVRNCVLLCGAGLVVWQRRAGASVSLVAEVGGLSALELAGLLLGFAAMVIVVAGVWFALHLLRQHGLLLLRVDALEAQMESSGLAAASKPGAGLPVGSVAPAFELPQVPGGASLALATLRAERKPILLIFSDPECGPCSALLPDIAGWERDYAKTLTIALVTRGSREANTAKLGEHKLKFVLLQKDREVAGAYKVNGTPGAVMIDREGMIASAPAMGSQAIRALVAGGGKSLPTSALATNGSNGAALMKADAPLGLTIGEPAPPIKLPDLSGAIVDFALGQQETLVLFWNPTCGFCAKMLPELKQWEEHHAGETPRVLIVSAGSAEANRAMGLRSHVLLDQTFATGRAFHVRGTPGAVLVDADGNIASGVASGAQAVLALANTSNQRSVVGID